MSIDDSALRDPRVKRLARMLHEKFGNDVAAWPDFALRYALGTLLIVWALPYDRVNPVVPQEDIDEAAFIDHFAEAMVMAGLGDNVADGMWVKGAKKRIKYLEQNEARNGGSSPAAETPDKPKKEPKVERYKETVAHFHQRYVARFERKPTWNGKAGRLLVPLIRTHGADEVIRRIDVLFDSPPSFLLGSPPDVGTLAQHFDKLVAPAGRVAPRGSGRFEPADGIDYEKAPWEP